MYSLCLPYCLNQIVSDNFRRLHRLWGTRIGKYGLSCSNIRIQALESRTGKTVKWVINSTLNAALVPLTKQLLSFELPTSTMNNLPHVMSAYSTPFDTK